MKKFELPENAYDYLELQLKNKERTIRRIEHSMQIIVLSQDQAVVQNKQQSPEVLAKRAKKKKDKQARVVKASAKEYSHNNTLKLVIESDGLERVNLTICPT